MSLIKVDGKIYAIHGGAPTPRATMTNKTHFWSEKHGRTLG